MGAVVQARLDEETRAMLKRLVQRSGMSASEVVREGIRLVEAQRSGPALRKLIGVGMFDSGISDLGSNKSHLKGLGEKSMGRGWRRPEEVRARKTKLASAKVAKARAKGSTK